MNDDDDDDKENLDYLMLLMMTMNLEKEDLSLYDNQSLNIKRNICYFVLIFFVLFFF